MREPLVPLWVAVLVAVLISMDGFALAYNDPQLTFLTPTVRFLLGLANMGLGTFAFSVWFWRYAVRSYSSASS